MWPWNLSLMCEHTLFITFISGVDIQRFLWSKQWMGWSGRSTDSSIYECRRICWQTWAHFTVHLYSTSLLHWVSVFAIELDLLEEYRPIDPPRLWEAVSGEGWIQKWSLFQLDSLFSPHLCTNEMGKKATWQPPILCPAFWLAQKGFIPLFR